MATSGEGTLDNEDRLPWLEAVEDEDERQGPSAGKLIGALIVGLTAIALIIYVLFWLGNRDGSANRSGEPELITADGGDYKVKPADAGGMKVEGAGDSALAASEGADPDGRINLDAIPEAPVAGSRGIAPAPQMQTKAQDGKAAPTKAPPAPVPAPEPVRAASGSLVQLGAFSSEASAKAAWTSLSGRFASLKPLSNSVIAAQVGGKTVYRLRAGAGSSADARTLCGKLKVAGESCVIVD